MDQEKPLMKKPLDGLTPFTTSVYAIGHVFNDLCAACWFNYLLYYLTDVQMISSSIAGIVMLAGQLADGFATPLVGLYSDKFNTRIGKRKPWYIFGTVVVLLCFFFVFEKCYPCEDLTGSDESVMQAFWYSIYAALFNVGWAAVQVSHMSLIPALTPIKERKERLIALRTSFTYISNIAVLLIALLLFKIIDSPKTQFSVLTVMVIVIGLSISTLFIFVIKEVELSSIASTSYRELDSVLKNGGVRLGDSTESQHEAEEPETQMKWTDWLRQRQLFVIGAVYMLARLANNLMTSLMPFYLTVVLSTGGVSNVKEASENTPWELALIPLIMYLGSVCGSLVQSRIGVRMSRRKQYLIGAICILAGCVSMIFLEHSSQYAMVPVAAVLGVGFSFELNNSMGFISAFVGNFGTSGAFVFGFVSLLDKFCTGTALMLATNLGDFDSSSYIRIIAVVVPLVGSSLGALTAFFVKNIQEYSEGKGTDIAIAED